MSDYDDGSYAKPAIAHARPSSDRQKIVIAALRRRVAQRKLWKRRRALCWRMIKPIGTWAAAGFAAPFHVELVALGTVAHDAIKGAAGWIVGAALSWLGL
jgi:hypothetical protein